MSRAFLLGVLIVSAGWFALAQAVDEKRGQKPSTNEAQNVSSFIDEDAQIEGVVIINGAVSIDGVKIPKGQKKYKSARSGKTYLIEWGRDDNVHVTEQ